MTRPGTSMAIPSISCQPGTTISDLPATGIGSGMTTISPSRGIAVAEPPSPNNAGKKIVRMPLTISIAKMMNQVNNDCLFLKTPSPAK